jgi:hypothetical protein
MRPLRRAGRANSFRDLRFRSIDAHAFSPFADGIFPRRNLRIFLGGARVSGAGGRLKELRPVDRLIEHKQYDGRSIGGVKQLDWFFPGTRLLQRAGYVPKTPPVVHATGTHYAAALAYGDDLVPVSPSGEVMPGVHLCDSAVFLDSPGTSPTFKIMANECRTVLECLDD